MMTFNKISLKILLPLIAIFIISFLGITLFVVQSQARFAREQLIKNARVSAQAILSSSVDLFIKKAVYDIQFVLVNAKKSNEDIEYIAIVDTQGKALAHTEVLLIDTMLNHTAFDRAALTFSTLTVREIPDTRDVFEVCVPMLAFGSEKEMLGVLRIGVNQRMIHAKMAHIRRNIIGVGIAAVLISILLFTGIVEKDGSEVETSMTATLRRADNGTILGYQGIVRDMTIQKQAERERLQSITLRQEKERAEIAQRAAENAQRASEAANRAKTVFLANMSHELRTPLNGILGYARILEHDSSLRPKQTDAVEIILRNGEHLLLLLEDILDFSKIETNQFELHPAEFVLPRMLRRIMQIIRIHAQEKQLSFQYEPPPELPQVVYGDEKRLRQILLNLLGNAVKFTEHGTVTFKILDLRFKISEKEDVVQSKISNLKFQIRDTGVGIAPEQIENIFQPFWQPGTYLSHSEGMGLGLAISQRLAEKMGSQIQITSTVGQGTTCWFELELPVIAVTTSEEPPHQSGHSEILASPERLVHSLGALPSELLATLRQGAEDVDVDTLSEVLVRIGEYDSMLADTLTRLRDKFEYDEILQLIQETKKEKWNYGKYSGC